MSKVKQIVKLIPKNRKGFNFVKTNGNIHGCKYKKNNDIILRDKFNKKIIISKNDKRFKAINYTNSYVTEVKSNESLIDYFE